MAFWCKYTGPRALQFAVGRIGDGVCLDDHEVMSLQRNARRVILTLDLIWWKKLCLPACCRRSAKQVNRVFKALKIDRMSYSPCKALGTYAYFAPLLQREGLSLRENCTESCGTFHTDEAPPAWHGALLWRTITEYQASKIRRCG